MEVRAVKFSTEAADDLLLMLTEEDCKEYAWPQPVLKQLLEAQGFTGKLGETASCVYLSEGAGRPRRAIAAGMGKAEELTLEKVRRSFGAGLKEAAKQKIETLTIAPLTCGKLSTGEAARAVTEAFLLASYRFDRYLAEKKPCSVRSLQIGFSPEHEKEVLSALKLGQTLGETTNLARDLVNDRPMCDPERLAAEAKKAGKKSVLRWRFWRRWDRGLWAGGLPCRGKGQCQRSQVDHHAVPG